MGHVGRTDASYDSQKSQAGDGILKQVWPSGPDERGALTQATIVVGRVWAIEM